jgi:hypothetical protein
MALYTVSRENLRRNRAQIHVTKQFAFTGTIEWFVFPWFLRHLLLPSKVQYSLLIYASAPSSREKYGSSESNVETPNHNVFPHFHAPELFCRPVQCMSAWWEENWYDISFMGKMQYKNLLNKLFNHLSPRNVCRWKHYETEGIQLSQTI